MAGYEVTTEKIGEITIDSVEQRRLMLVSLCDQGVVPVDKWSNRDSSSAQRQLAECRGLLAAGCEYLAVDDGSGHWNVTVYYPGFDYFEYGPDDLPDRGLKNETYYVPTQERLLNNEGEDWY